MRPLLSVAIAILASTMIWAQGLRAQPAVTVTVDMQDYAFEPHETGVAAGTAVRWVNRDDAPHHVVTETTKTVDSGLIAPGSTFTFTFAQHGRFEYRCAVHPTMLGIINVR
jgi:plastocyanin